MTLFSEDLRAFQRGLEIEGTSAAMPDMARTGVDPRRTTSRPTTFQEDLESFQSQPSAKSVLGSVALRAAEEADIAVEKARQDITAREINRQRQELLRQFDAEDSRTRNATGDPTTGAQMSVEMHGTQDGILGSRARVSQKFGAINPNIEVFSGGVNYGTDFAAKRGTPVAIPEGEWEVVDSWGGAKRDGFIGNGDNSGYGNSVLIKNTETGELMRFSHLERGSVRAQPGQKLRGGMIFAMTGSTGNSTGPHLDLEYIDSSGRYKDVLGTPYGAQMFGTGRLPQGGGNPIQAIGNFIRNLGQKEDQRAREIEEVRQREGNLPAVGAASVNTEPMVTRLNKFLKEKNLPGQTITGALSDRALEDEVVKAATKARQGIALEKKERKILAERAMQSVAGVAMKPPTKAERAMAKSLSSIRKNLNSGVAKNEIRAIGDLEVLGEKELGKAAMKHIRSKTFIGSDRINAILAELEGLAQNARPRVRVEKL